jgi:hypothetical protein
MSVANLTRYHFEREVINPSCSCGMRVEKYGSYVKFDEAMEASSNSLQQLKAEIAALVNKHLPTLECGCLVYDPLLLSNALRQLSAV